MLEHQGSLTRFQEFIDHVSPSSVTFNDGSVPLEMYDEETIINILEELNPEMAGLVRDYGLSKTLGVLDKLELLGTADCPHQNGTPFGGGSMSIY
jgi:hypothetical protein